MGGQRRMFMVDVKGYDHPFLCRYVGHDLANSGSDVGAWYVVHVGWERGIYQKYSGVWARTVDYHVHTRRTPEH